MFTMTEARARFETRFPELQSKAKAYFADYKPEAKDEAVANSLFLTWHHFVSLIEKGKADDQPCRSRSRNCFSSSARTAHSDGFSR